MANVVKPLKNRSGEFEGATPTDFAALPSPRFSWQFVRHVLLRVVLVGLIAYLSLSTVGAAYAWPSPPTAGLHDVLVWFGFLAIALITIFAFGTLMLSALMLIVFPILNFKTVTRVLK